MRKYTDFAIYNNSDEILTIGTAKECAEYLGITLDSFWSHRTRQNEFKIKGKTRQGYKNYQIVRIEDD
jgi:hypothetical protein